MVVSIGYRIDWLKKKMPINEIRSESNQIGIQINYKTIFNEHLINVISFGFYFLMRPFTTLTTIDIFFDPNRRLFTLDYRIAQLGLPDKAASLHGWTWMSWSQSNYSLDTFIDFSYLFAAAVATQTKYKERMKHAEQAHCKLRIKTLRFWNLIRFSRRFKRTIRPVNHLRFGHKFRFVLSCVFFFRIEAH